MLGLGSGARPWDSRHEHHAREGVPAGEVEPGGTCGLGSRCLFQAGFSGRSVYREDSSRGSHDLCQPVLLGVCSLGFSIEVSPGEMGPFLEL